MTFSTRDIFSNQSIRRDRPRGYVLVMTLLLLALAATALAAVASESHRRALQAVKAQDDLQQRWGALSCQHAILPKASKVIEAMNRGKPQVSSKMSLTIPLGRQVFQVVVSDEQAKVNLNALAQLPGNRYQDVAVKLVPANVSLALAPKQSSSTDKEGKTVDQSSFDSYGQIFDIDVPPGLIMKAGADRITCWGDGLLNTKLAPREAIMQLYTATMTADELDAFEKAKKKSPQKPPADILSEAGLPADKKEAINKLLGTTSSCYSMWIVSNPKGQASYRFAVRAGENEDDTRVFEW